MMSQMQSVLFTGNRKVRKPENIFCKYISVLVYTTEVMVTSFTVAAGNEATLEESTQQHSGQSSHRNSLGKRNADTCHSWL